MIGKDRFGEVDLYTFVSDCRRSGGEGEIWNMWQKNELASIFSMFFDSIRKLSNSYGTNTSKLFMTVSGKIHS